jgi:hypothetical protein
MMNFWIPNFSDWNDGFEAVDMPWYARYDYVEYWEYVKPEDWETTPGANKYHPFKMGWRDDFDTFDTDRWKASNDWTFGVNEVTFWESQVYTEDSMLVLKMEPRDNDQGTGGEDNAGGNEGNNGSTDGPCECKKHYEALLTTIALLEEQLQAF